MAPRKDERFNTPTPQELQALYDLIPELKEARKIVALSPTELQKMIERKREIKQEMIEEYCMLSEQIRLLILDRESVVNEITDLLVTGAPVCKGRRNVRPVDGYLALDLVELPNERG
jgi:hypothetical protein